MYFYRRLIGWLLNANRLITTICFHHRFNIKYLEGYKSNKHHFHRATQISKMTLALLLALNASLQSLLPETSVLSGSKSHPAGRRKQDDSFPVTFLYTTVGRNQDNPDHNSFSCAPHQLSLALPTGFTALEVHSGTTACRNFEMLSPKSVANLAVHCYNTTRRRLNFCLDELMSPTSSIKIDSSLSFTVNVPDLAPLLT